MNKNDFAYLRKGNDDIPVECLNDESKFADLMFSLKNKLKFSDPEILTIWKIISAILYIGNLEIDISTYDEYKNKPSNIKNKDTLDKISKLFSCNSEALEYEIMYRTKILDSDRVACNPNEVFTQRDSLAKALYQSLFSWIVNKLNENLITGMNKNVDSKTLFELS